MADLGWRVEVTGALRAHFIQPDGSSKPGMDWSVAVTGGSDEKHIIIVRAYDEAVINASTEHGGRLILRYVVSLLDSGWSPIDYHSIPGELVYSSGVTPSAERPAAKKSPWWRIW